MDTLAKLHILADAAKYDAACTSSGAERGPAKGKLGIATNAGCCHSFTQDGRCVTLLKVLMSNACSHDCAYCVNRRGNAVPRATFEPRELAQLTVDFYKRNYIEGLFLSSGVLGSPDATAERMIGCLELLRGPYRFNGYVHAKVIPGTDSELVERLGLLADRLSANVELPSAASLAALCPQKHASDVIAPMAQIHETILMGRALGPGRGGSGPPARRSSAGSALSAEPVDFFSERGGAPTYGTGALGGGSYLSTVRPSHVPKRPQGPRKAGFCPAGQSTQLIVGATPEDDRTILDLSTALYRRFGLKRVFFSAYMPVVEDARLPHPETPVPLRREHRLYQADWLMRFYGFEAAELVSDDAPFLDLDVDPKLAWALSAMERFPVEVNAATKEELLRVPGLGPRGVAKILRARRSHRLTFDDLDRLKIRLKRAGSFITCEGERDSRFPSSPDQIRKEVVANARDSTYNRTQRQLPEQLTLF